MGSEAWKEIAGFRETTTVIRTSVVGSRFLGSARLNAELQPDRWTISGSEGFRRFFFASLWIKLRSTTGNRSPKAWKPRAIPKAGFTFVPVQLLMGSLIPCQTSQSCWLTLLDLLENRDGVGHRAMAPPSQAFRETRAREPANIPSPKRLQWC